MADRHGWEGCPDCPDHEACNQGAPCHIVKYILKGQGTVDDIKSEKQDPDTERMINVLQDWWMEKSKQEVEACAPKAVEYGSGDLAEIGRQMSHMMGLNGSLNHAQYTELGIYFYLVGKIARWADALKNGRRVSEDTLHDIAVYTKMAQRNHEFGGWPWPPSKDGDDLPNFLPGFD